MSYLEIEFSRKHFNLKGGNFSTVNTILQERVQFQHCHVHAKNVSTLKAKCLNIYTLGQEINYFHIVEIKIYASFHYRK